MHRQIPNQKPSLVITFLFSLLVVAGPRCVFASDNLCLDVNVAQTATLTSGSTSTGIIRHGGILTGSTADTFTSALVATPDPDTFSFTDTFTFTTKAGTLTTSDVSLFDTTHLLYTSIQRISSGTGIFVGATGTLFSSGSSTDGINFTDTFIGQLCLALRG